MGLWRGCIAAGLTALALAACGGRALPAEDGRVKPGVDVPDFRVVDAPRDFGRVDAPRDFGPPPPPPDFGFDRWRPPDVWLPPPPPPPAKCDPAVIGRPCSQNGGECGSLGTCLLISQVYGGVCGCQCTPDDPNTPLVNEDNCPTPTKNLCGAITLSDGSTLNLCMRRCTPRFGSSDCARPLACLPETSEHARRIDQAVCLAIGCQSDSDCPVRTALRCDTSNPGCPSGQSCVPLDDKTTRGACATPGKCELASGLCAAHSGSATATIGAPCGADTDCGANMTCELELDPQASKLHDHGAPCTNDDQCCGKCEATRCAGSCRVEQRNGYCSLRGCTFANSVKQWTCPAGSTCNRMVFGGMCQKTCDPSKPNDCRNNANDRYGDYECYAWNNFSIRGVQVTSSPVCTPNLARCDTFGANPQLSCASLGPPTNATQMACRALSTKQPTIAPRDPAGFCLDSTTSGP